MIRSITAFIILILLDATASAQTGKILNPIVCKTDPTQSYALYIPAGRNKETLPVIYFFDPHADGALPLHKYQKLADEYGFILVGSNNSKNGNDWPTTETIWRHLSDDVQNRVKINKDRVYTAGFSGGAKVAGYVAIQHPIIKGVIAGGAGMPDGVTAGDFGFSFTALAGEGDLNLTDLVSFQHALDKTGTRHRIIFFDGKHEWAPAGSMSVAFTGLQFDAMRQSLIPKDAAFINRYVAKSKSNIAAYFQKGQLIKAEQECRLSLSLLDGLTGETAWFKKQAASLSGNTHYQQQRQAQEKLLVREQQTKTEYMQHFQQDNPGYWSRTIHDLQMAAGAKTAEGAMHQRLLAYLSLAFYSISNQLIGGNANNEARHFVELYKMADPANSEAWYFSAILHARDGDTHSTESDLLQAVKTGFRDNARLHQQPEFQKLSPPIDFSRIGKGMPGHM